MFRKGGTSVALSNESYTSCRCGPCGEEGEEGENCKYLTLPFVPPNPATKEKKERKLKAKLLKKKAERRERRSNRASASGREVPRNDTLLAAPIVIPIVDAPALLDRPAAPPPPVREPPAALTQLAQLDYPATPGAVPASVQPADPSQQSVVATPAARRPIPKKNSLVPIFLDDCGGISITRDEEKKESDPTNEPKTTRTRAVLQCQRCHRFLHRDKNAGINQHRINVATLHHRPSPAYLPIYRAENNN